ncbi:MAG: hypothetical protein QOF14_5488 [Hyphomicrobiales bacterium]|nr:hypothetical protein [Hyphomicrobiales bacterium]
MEVATESQAVQLLDRVGDLNRTSLLPTIERVLDEFDRPDLVLGIGRIDLDIGTIPAERLELAAERLETALRDALMRALDGSNDVPAQARRPNALEVLPAGAALLDLLTRYLLRGIWPYQVRGDEAGDPAALLSALIDSEPDTLVQLVRRHRSRPELVERLGKQLSFTDLERLLHLLESDNATSILESIVNLRRIHRVNRIVPVSDASFARLLWPLVLRHVLTEADAVFDARAFERRLRASVAELSNAEVELPNTERIESVLSVRDDSDGPGNEIALAGTIGELESKEASDHSLAHAVAPVSVPAPIDLLEQFLLHGSGSGTKPETLMLLLANDDPDALARLFRRHAWNDAILRRVTEVMSTTALGRLLTVLEPEAAAPILEYMIDIRTLHRSEPIVALSDPALARLLWHIALRYVLREAGTQFNRRSFVAALIEDVAVEERLSYREVVAVLHRGVAEMAKAHPVTTSLPAIINDLATELEPAEFHVGPLSALERLLRDGRQVSAAELRQAIEITQEQDPLGLRRLLRWHAERDPARIVQTVGAALSVPSLIRLLLHTDAAQEVVALALRLASAPTSGTLPAHRLDIAVVAAIALSGAPAEGSGLLARIVQSVAQVAGVAPTRLAISLATRRDGGNASGPSGLGQTADGGHVALTRAFDSQDSAVEADDIAALYVRLDQFRHFLRTGVLPWRDILAEPALTPHRLVDSLARAWPGFVRAALAATRLHRSTLGSALARLTEADVARVIGWLLPGDAAARELPAAIAAHAAKAINRKAFQADVIAALVEGRPLDLEAFAATSAGIRATPTDLETADRLISVLAEGIGQREIAPPNWQELLIRLLTRDPQAARRFLTAGTSRPAGLARLAELCAPPFLERLLAALVPAAASTLTALGESLTAYGAHRGPGRQAITEAILTEALSIEPDTVPGFALMPRLLRTLFGDAMPPSLMPALRRDLLPSLPRGIAAAVAAAIGWEEIRHRRDAVSLQASSDDRAGRLRLVDDDGIRPVTAAIDPRETEAPTRRQMPELINERLDAWLRAWRSGDAEARAEPEGVHTEWLFRALADRDLSRASPGMEVPELLSELLGQLVESPRPELAARLAAFLHQARNHADLIRLLPERLLARLIILAVPHVGRDLLEAGELLAETAVAAGSPFDRAALWQALFATAAAPPGERTVARLAEHVFTMAGRVAHGASAVRRDTRAEALLRAAARRARDAGHVSLVSVLSGRQGALVAAYTGTRHHAPARAAAAAVRAKRQTPPIRARTAFRLGGDDDAALKGEPIYIGNAGLVLANPFLPRLFDALGLMESGEDGKWRLRASAASRGVHLLQYLVDGRTDRAEPVLVLNKLLCGLPISTPIERDIEPSETERETCDTLLRSMIDNWPIIRGTSVAVLRETFLQRDGKLTLAEGGWRLQVQRKTLDVLVDQVPWSIGIVFHRWMPGALHVTW